MPYFLNFQIRCVVRFMRSPGSMFCKVLSHPVSPQTIEVTSIADFVCVFSSVSFGGEASASSSTRLSLGLGLWKGGWRLLIAQSPSSPDCPPTSRTGIQLPQSQRLPHRAAHLTALTLARVIPFRPSSFKAQTPHLKIVKAARITGSQCLPHDESSHGFGFGAILLFCPGEFMGAKEMSIVGYFSSSCPATPLPHFPLPTWGAPA